MILYSINIYSQNNFWIGGSISYNLTGTATSFEEFSFRSIRILNDSIGVIDSTFSMTEQVNEYSSKTGLNVHGKIQIQISDKLNLETGLGLSWNSTDRSSMRNSLSFDRTAVDTIDLNSSSTPDVFTSSCDAFTNSFQDFDISDVNQIHAIHLTIPVELTYSVLENLLEVGIGGYMRTPLFTSFSREFLRIERQQAGQQTLCTLVEVREHDQSGNGFRNLQLGFSAGIKYYVDEDLRITFAADKLLNGLFIDPDSQPFPLNDDEFNPWTFSIGVDIPIGSEKEMN